MFLNLFFVTPLYSKIVLSRNIIDKKEQLQIQQKFTDSSAMKYLNNLLLMGNKVCGGCEKIHRESVKFIFNIPFLTIAEV